MAACCLLGSVSFGSISYARLGRVKCTRAGCCFSRAFSKRGRALCGVPVGSDGNAANMFKTIGVANVIGGLRVRSDGMSVASGDGDATRNADVLIKHGGNGVLGYYIGRYRVTTGPAGAGRSTGAKNVTKASAKRVAGYCIAGARVVCSTGSGVGTKPTNKVTNSDRTRNLVTGYCSTGGVVGGERDCGNKVYKGTSSKTRVRGYCICGVSLVAAGKLFTNVTTGSFFVRGCCSGTGVAFVKGGSSNGRLSGGTRCANAFVGGRSVPVCQLLGR